MRASACGVHRGLGMESWTRWRRQPKPGSYQRVNCVHNRFGLLIDFLLHEVAKLALHDFGNLNIECFEAAGG